MKRGYRNRTVNSETARLQIFSGGQTFIEYTILISVVLILLFMISPMMRRTTQSLVRLVADQIGNQADADQSGGEAGYMESVYMHSRTDRQKTVSERMGSLQTDYLDLDELTSNQVTNLGYTER